MAVNFEITRERIKVGKDGFFDVRGLNTEDLTFLTTEYLDDLKNAVAKHGRSSGTVPKDKMAEVLLELAKDFPSMTSEIISRAAEAPEEQDKFRQLPFPIALSALKAITRLTVEDGGIELGNLLAGLVAMLEVNGIHLGPLGTQLQTTIASAGKTSPS